MFFGERWITSIFDLFEENVRYFPALLPETTEENPEEVLAAGRAPRLQELRLHNGTVYRWNRPVYDVVGGRPHLRVENRVLPAGPTVVDVLANAAFYYGALTGLAAEERPVWTKMSFDAAHTNFVAGARHGVDAMFYWPGFGEVPWDELLLRHLLPAGRRGTGRWDVATPVRDRLLGIVAGRCKTRRNGAWWQTETVAAFESRGLSRDQALDRDAQAVLGGHAFQRAGAHLGGPGLTRQATQSAVIVAIPEAEAAVAALRLRLDPAAAWGVPAHVTVLYPFLPPDEIDGRALAERGVRGRDRPGL